MDQPRKSIKDKQLQATLYLKEVSSRMKDIIFELNTLHKTFSDKDSSIRQKTNVLASLKKCNHSLSYRCVRKDDLFL